ncbi:MAG: oligosaccharide flippase family protein [Alphaproteobacteria bacterium]|nr:oligosaccharide flippase family protein [Alphaproteobacteria bacterium]
MSPTRKKLTWDGITSLFSLGVMGLSGLATNIVIVRGWNTETLGLFNQLFALYVFTSMLGAFGIQSSALKYIAEYDDRPEEQASLFASGLALVLAFASLAVLTLAFLSPAVGVLFSSPDMRLGTLLILPGIWANAVNKFLLCSLNARLRLRTYAFLTAMRFALIPLSATFLLMLGSAGFAVCLCLCIAELITLAALVCANVDLIRQGRQRLVRAWAVRHFHFGRRAVLGGMAVELNSRIDILLLGVFASESEVGIYSFAALLFEGLMHLPLLARRFVDPLLAQWVAARRLDDLTKLIRSSCKHGVWLVGAGFLAAALLYPWFARLAGGNSPLEAGYPALLILLGLGFLPGIGAILANFPAQAGYPGAQSRLSLITLAVNLVLGLILIPPFGIIGAALAVGTGLLIGLAEQARLIRSQLNRLYICPAAENQ